MNRIRINIEGLQQNETQHKVKKQLEGLAGVNDVSMSKGQTYVDINYDERTSIEEINSHLQNNGYKVMDKE